MNSETLIFEPIIVIVKEIELFVVPIKKRVNLQQKE